MKRICTFLIAMLMMASALNGQHSVARQWNEVLLESIRHDLGRPTVHSRNLFHISTAMYDAWAAYDDVAVPCFLGNEVGPYQFLFDGVEIPGDPVSVKNAQNMAVSYAVYRLLKHRFAHSVGAGFIIPLVDSLMLSLNYDTALVSTDYTQDGPAAFGNYLALSIIEFGFLDGADEEFDYEYDDLFYQPVNPPLAPSSHGDPSLIDLNHWQPLAPDSITPRRFLNPQWGRCTPFSLNENDLEVQDRNGVPYYLYHDPGQPPYLDTATLGGLDDFYKWNFALNAVWSSHLDPSDTTMVDISPAAVGNLTSLPTTEEEFRAFYNFFDGGVADSGYDLNPKTGAPYESQWVPRGDFGRV
ncbi:MAG: hypothetical protein HKN76_03085, partial [Saprospiraceae bacterium]|nr:hypothetical protein [Saprospiraceae bacterium]